MTSKYFVNEFVLSCSLVCGDVCGKFNILYGRVRNILKKNKDFEVNNFHFVGLVYFQVLSIKACT